MPDSPAKWLNPDNPGEARIDPLISILGPHVGAIHRDAFTCEAITLAMSERKRAALRLLVAYDRHRAYPKDKTVAKDCEAAFEQWKATQGNSA